MFKMCSQNLNCGQKRWLRPYRLRRRLLQWDDDPHRYSRQSQKIQEHSHWESSCQSPTCPRWALCDNVSLSFFQHFFCSPMGRQSYWLPQPRRLFIIAVFKSISGRFTYRSSLCFRFFVIRSVSGLSYIVRPLTPLFRLRRGPRYTFKSEHTPCNSLCNFPFHKGLPNHDPSMFNWLHAYGELLHIQHSQISPSFILTSSFQRNQHCSRFLLSISIYLPRFALIYSFPCYCFS